MDRRIYEHPHRRWDRGAPTTVEFEGRSYRAFAREPLAVALFASGVRVLSRSIKYHRPRAFFCLEGHCGGCLMRVDDLPSVRACQERCREGMAAAGQNAFPASDVDVLAAVDWLFPRGMDHHTLLTGSRMLNQVMQKLVRHVSGLGKVPGRSTPREQFPPVERRSYDVVVVGGGPAGLAAATAAAQAGARTLCVDEQDRAGGSLLAHPTHGPEEADRRVAAARAVGVELRERSPAIGWFPEDDGGVLAVATPDGLWHATARRYVYATGASDVNGLFGDNDRPGIFSARAVGRLAVQHGIRPGERVAVVGEGDYTRALTAELDALGIETEYIGTRVVRAHGHAWVESLEAEDARGRMRRMPCDAVAVAERPSPLSDAPRQHGAAVALSETAGGFAVVVEPGGRSSVPTVFACGDVTGYVGVEQATKQGSVCGRAAAEDAS